MKKWLKKLNARPDDDTKLNLFHLLFWVGIFGLVGLFLVTS